MSDVSYILNIIKTTPRYKKFARVIVPNRVYIDPIIDKACIVELPFDIPFRADMITWQATRFSHRLPYFRSDELGFFAILRSYSDKGKKLFDILFTGEQVFTIYERWIYFAGKGGKNLIKAFYEKSPKPELKLTSYEKRAVSYDAGAIYGKHHNLTQVLQGLEV